MRFLIDNSRTVKVELFDATTLAAVRGVQLRLEGSATSRSPDSAHPATVVFPFSPSQGPIHKLKLSLTFPPTFRASDKTPTILVFALSVAQAMGEIGLSSTGPTASSSTAALRSTIGEPRQPVIETWDDRKFVLMSLRSGPVEIRIEKEPARIAQDKGESSGTRTLTRCSAYLHCTCTCPQSKQLSGPFISQILHLDRSQTARTSPPRRSRSRNGPASTTRQDSAYGTVPSA